MHAALEQHTYMLQPSTQLQHLSGLPSARSKIERAAHLLVVQATAAAAEVGGAHLLLLLLAALAAVAAEVLQESCIGLSQPRTVQKIVQNNAGACGCRAAVQDIVLNTLRNDHGVHDDMHCRKKHIRCCQQRWLRSY
jgi:hypothetical protein